MRYGFCVFWVLLIACQVIAQQPISAIKNLPPGSVVTTTGTVLNGEELGTIRYMQDQHAGIAMYSKSLSGVQKGDSIIVTGVLSSYKGEVQLSPIMSYQVISTGRSLEAVLTDDIASVSISDYTSRLISVNCVAFQSCEPVFSEGPFTIYDQFGHTTRAFVSEGHSLIDNPINSEPKIAIGIWTSNQAGFHLILTDLADASEGNCHLLPVGLVTFPLNGTHALWLSIPDEETWVEYGVDSFDKVIHIPDPGFHLAAFLDSIEPGEIYKVRMLQRVGTDTFFSPVTQFIDREAGEPIEVLFNHDVDESFSDGSKPSATGPSVIESDLIDRIDAVQHTLEIAMYNTGRPTLVQAVKRAVQRGVQVRYIADDETSNSALEGETAFPILYRSESGIMHNKFVIADADYGELAWVWSGSTNWTPNQLTSDPNHAYIIKSKAQALNFRLEFEEMWGSNPQHAGARAGDDKRDNTIHRFSFNQSGIESYFSPSDETECAIQQAIASADHHIEIGLLLLTSETLINQIIALHDTGVQVRVILEDEKSSSYAVFRLQDAGVPLVFHEPSSIFHHKYAMVDDGYPDSNPLTITGSHNWTFSADHINDENTLIIHDARVTNIFRQEFEARWKELYQTAVNESKEEDILVFPNPARNGFQFVNPSPSVCKLTLLDVNGKRVQQYSIDANQSAFCEIQSPVPSGYYLLKCVWDDRQTTIPISVLE